MKKYLMLGLLLGVFKVYSQGYSLKEAQDYAVKNNKNMQKAQLDIEISKKKIWETTAAGLPQINGEVKFLNYVKIPTTVVPDFADPVNNPPLEIEFGTNYSLTASAQLTQLIFDGSYIVALQASKTYKKISELAAEKTEKGIREAVAQAYYGAVIAKENNNVLDSILISMEAMLHETNIVYTNGLAEKQDVDQMKLSMSNVENSLKRAVAQQELALYLLKYQMGLGLEDALTITEDKNSLMSAVDPATLLTKAENFSLNQHVDHQIVQNQVVSNGLLLKNEKAKYLPSLAGFFQYQRQAQGDQFNFFSSDGTWFPGAFWGVNLNVPIFASGARKSRTDQANMQLKKAELDLSLLEEGMRIQIKQSKSDFNVTLDILKSEEENLKLAEGIMKSVQEKKKQGLASSIDLAQVNNQYLQTEGNYIKAFYDWLMAKNALDKAINNF